MAIREIDPIGQAIIATEKEIAGAAWGEEEPVLDETGDRTIEAMGEGLEGQHEADDDDAETEGEESEGEEESQEGEGEAEEDGEAEGETEAAAKAGDKEKPAPTEPEGRVPPGRLREQTEKAKAAEARAAKLEADLAAASTKSQQEIAALNAKFEATLAVLQRQAPAKAAEEVKPATVPDFFEDPAGFIAHQNKPMLDTVSQLRNDLATQRVETSMALAHAKHGEVFTKAYDAALKLNPQNPDDRATVQRIYSSPNQGEALVAWHKRNETLREVGDDPTKFREKIAAETRESLMKDPEFRKSLLDGLRAEASRGANGEPNTTVRLPKSLNGAAGGNRRDATVTHYDDNDQAIAANAWVDR